MAFKQDYVIEITIEGKMRRFVANGGATETAIRKAFRQLAKDHNLASPFVLGKGKKLSVLVTRYE